MKNGITKTVVISLLVLSLLASVALVIWLMNLPYWSYPLILIAISLLLFLASLVITSVPAWIDSVHKYVLGLNYMTMVRSAWVNRTLRKRYARQIIRIRLALLNTDVSLVKRKIFLLIGDSLSVNTSLMQASGVKILHGVDTKQEDFTCWDINGSLYVDISKLLKTESSIKNVRKIECLVRAFRSVDKNCEFQAITMCIKLDNILQNTTLVFEEMTKNVHRKIIEVQAALKLILPLHIVITNVETVAGLNDFFSTLPIKKSSAAFGYCLELHSEIVTFAGFIRAAYSSLYSSLNQLRLIRPITNDVTDISEVHFVPEKFLSSKNGVYKFLNAAVPVNTQKSLFQVGSLHFTAVITPREEQKGKTVGLDSNVKDVSIGFKRECFSQDLFSTVIPGLEYLDAIPLSNGGWSQWFSQNKPKLIVSVFTLVLFLMTIILFRNIQDLEQFRK